MTMETTVDPKTGKRTTTYSDPKKTEEFADKLAKAMVDHLNKTVTAKKTPTK